MNLHPRGMIDLIDVWPTIQGEGPYQGCRAIFIRLAGCNLQCPACDTDYTTNRRMVSPTMVVDLCQSFMKKSLVVITGGEPFRQNISPLVRLLLNTGYQVQIETNGTCFLDGMPWSKVTIVCSPKTGKLDEELPIHYYKYVLDAEHVSKEDGLPTSVLGMRAPPARPRKNDLDINIPVYVQPAEPMEISNKKYNEKMKANQDAVVVSCMTFGYRVCLQIHKYLGLR
jgi:7-carboxy-7-deazaguanine synthase